MIYMMSFGWIPGCTEFASQRPDSPVDPESGFDWVDLLEDIYYICESSITCPDLHRTQIFFSDYPRTGIQKGSLGGYIDIGCLRYTSSPGPGCN